MPTAAGSQQSIDDIRENYRVHAGPFYVEPAILLKELGVDTNVFNQAGDTNADFTMVVAPQAAVAVPFGNRALVKSLLGTDLVYYAQYASERSVDPQAAVRAEVLRPPPDVLRGGVLSEYPGAPQLRDRFARAAPRERSVGRSGSSRDHPSDGRGRGQAWPDPVRRRRLLPRSASEGDARPRHAGLQRDGPAPAQRADHHRPPLREPDRSVPVVAGPRHGQFSRDARRRAPAAGAAQRKRLGRLPPFRPEGGGSAFPGRPGLAARTFLHAARRNRVRRHLRPGLPVRV